MKLSTIILFFLLLFVGSCESDEYIPQCKGKITAESIILETTYGVVLNIKNTGTSKMTYASIEFQVHFSSKTETRNAYCDSLHLMPGKSIIVHAKIYPPSDNKDKYWIRYDPVYDGHIYNFYYVYPNFECDY